MKRTVVIIISLLLVASLLIAYNIVYGFIVQCLNI